MNTIKAYVGKTKMIAHRGLSGLESENTMPAFIAAANRSFFGIETDVHLTKDNEFIIMHDSNTKRMTGTSTVIESSKFKKLRKLQVKDIDSKTERIDLKIPTLDEYLTVCKRYCKTAVIEIKGDFSVKEMDRVMASVGDYSDNAVIISFSYESLENLRVNHPTQNAQFLCQSIDDEMLVRLARDGFGLDISHKAMTEELFEKCIARGIATNVWIVNTKEDCEKYAKMGVDYITTNICEDISLAYKE